MAAEWWWWPSSLPAWLGSEATWFLVLNAVVAAIAVLSSRARPSPSASPRSGGAGVTRRASSVLLQRLRSFPIFSSYPSACFDTSTLLQSADAAHAGAQATEEEPPMTPPTMPMPPPRALVLTPQPAPAAEEEEEEEDPSAMSMEDAYALVLASRRPPEPEREDEEETRRRSDVDAKEKEKLRQQRLNSIFNYTQMLKQRALGAAGRRQPDARPDQL